MTKPSNISGIEKATGWSWDRWVALLDKEGAQNLEHKAIAEMVYERLQGKLDSASWWAQGVTVAYEQHIGRREPGQRNDGSFEVSVSRLMPGSKKDVFDLWDGAYAGTVSLDGVPVMNKRVSTTPVRYYWRCELGGGSRVAAAVEQKTPAKAMLVLSHTKLLSSADRDRWQHFWKDQLARLAKD